MKFRLLFLVVTLISSNCTYPPHVLDEHGNPIFNSVPIGEEDFGEYGISANYYTIIGNLNNPNSSVFVSMKPTIEQVWKFSTTLPSYFWIIHKNRDVIKIIGLNENLAGWESNWQWSIVDVKNNSKTEVPTYFAGALTEHRFHEVTHPESLLTAALNDKGTLVPFQKTIFRVVPYKEIYDEVKSLVEKYKLYDAGVNIAMVKIEPKKKPEKKMEKSELSKCGNSEGSFNVNNGKGIANVDTCLKSLFENQENIKKSGQKCHIARLVLTSQDKGKTTNKINEISHDFAYLPPDEHQFIYSFFPSFHACDTFTVLSEDSKDIVIGISSSNSTFQYFLNDIKLHFSKTDAGLVKIDGNVQMHTKRWKKETNETVEETVLCPYSIEYKKIKGLILPITSTYMQEMNFNGVTSYRIDEMHYQY
jgi:hypothetical protein